MAKDKPSEQMCSYDGKYVTLSFARTQSEGALIQQQTTLEEARVLHVQLQKLLIDIDIKLTMAEHGLKAVDGAEPIQD